jgi:hypothetical protein
LKKVETTRGIVLLGPIKKAKKSDFDPPEGWKLRKRQEWEFTMPDTSKVIGFQELWIHPDSKSGIMTYASFEVEDRVCQYGHKHLASEVYYIVEGYGIGTIDPKTLKEIGGFAPIERTEHATLEDARLALRYLMEDDLTLINGGPCLARQLAVPQVPKQQQ